MQNHLRTHFLTEHFRWLLLKGQSDFQLKGLEIDRERERETKTETERHTERQGDTERERQTQRETERHRETQRDTERHRETQRERDLKSTAADINSIAMPYINAIK